MENKYENNEYKFNKISSRFKNVSNVSFYTIMTRIAVREYVNYLNEREKHTEQIILNSGEQGNGQTFAIKKGGKYVVNERLVKQSIKRAKNKGEFRLFGFSKANIVLDKLEQALSQSK